MLTVDRLCGHIIHLIHAPIHVYDRESNLKAVYVDNGEQQNLLECDPAFQQELLRRRDEKCPVLHMEAERLIYGIISNETETYIMGPCALVRSTMEASQYLQEAHGLDKEIPYRLYHISIERFTEMVMMVYEEITDCMTSTSEILLNSFADEESEKILRRKVQQVFYENQEKGVVHNPYSQERREQESIRTGNMEALEESFCESYMGKLGTLSHNTLRNWKNMAIVLVTLASRSAMEGGVLPEIAYSMSDAYILRIEEVTKEGDAVALGRQAEREFCSLVRDTVKAEEQHPLVTKCKELVLKNLHKKIEVKELAEQLNTNPNYLSQLFARKEGMKLGDYIAREKINFAIQQLIYTDDSYEKIAYSYAFFSQSHFGRVFKKWTGMTPRQYREKYGEFAQK